MFATQAPFPEAPGVAQDDLTLDRARAMSIDLLGSDAEFDNSLGWYRIENGTPVDPQILFANVKDVTGTDAQARLGTLSADTEFGFFLIQDGFARNGGLLDPAAEFAFRGDPGSLQLFRIDDDSVRAIDGDILHTVDDFNSGGLTQTVSGLNDLDAFTIGFEDKVRADPAQGSDDDFNDAVFTLAYGNVVLPGLELTVDILDPDSPSMSRASVTITTATRQPGDRLFLDHVFDREGTDIVLTGEGTDRLELTGPASTGDFERVLEAVEPRGRSDRPRARTAVPGGGRRRATQQCRDRDGRHRSRGAARSRPRCSSRCRRDEPERGGLTGSRPGPRRPPPRPPTRPR